MYTSLFLFFREKRVNKKFRISFAANRRIIKNNFNHAPIPLLDHMKLKKYAQRPLNMQELPITKVKETILKDLRKG